MIYNLNFLGQQLLFICRLTLNAEKKTKYAVSSLFGAVDFDDQFVSFAVALMCLASWKINLLSIIVQYEK